MGATWGVRLALVVVLVALSVMRGCWAQNNTTTYNTTTSNTTTSNTTTSNTTTSTTTTYNTTWSDDGHITFYGSANGGGTQGGACAYQNTVALGYGYMTAALSTVLFLGGQACGACFEIRCKLIVETKTAKNWCYSYNTSIIITATNLCPPGSEGTWCDPPRAHFDLPQPAFLALAKYQGGVAPVLYRRTPCVRKGGIRFTMGGNPWFFMILIHNVPGAGNVVAVQIKSNTTAWAPMYRNWGALWTVRQHLTGALSFQITTGDSLTTILTNAVGTKWSFGQTWESSQLDYVHY